MRAKHAQQMKKEREEKIMQYNSKVKELKESIDKYSEENVQLES